MKETRRPLGFSSLLNPTRKEAGVKEVVGGHALEPGLPAMSEQSL